MPRRKRGQTEGLELLDLEDVRCIFGFTDHHARCFLHLYGFQPVESAEWKVPLQIALDYARDKRIPHAIYRLEQRAGLLGIPIYITPGLLLISPNLEYVPPFKSAGWDVCQMESQLEAGRVLSSRAFRAGVVDQVYGSDAMRDAGKVLRRDYPAMILGCLLNEDAQPNGWLGHGYRFAWQKPADLERAAKELRKAIGS